MKFLLTTALLSTWAGLSMAMNQINQEELPTITSKNPNHSKNFLADQIIKSKINNLKNKNYPLSPKADPEPCEDICSALYYIEAELEVYECNCNSPDPYICDDDCANKPLLEMYSKQGECNGCPSGVKNGEVCQVFVAALELGEATVEILDTCDCNGKPENQDLDCMELCTQNEVLAKTIEKDPDCGDAASKLVAFGFLSAIIMKLI